MVSTNRAARMRSRRLACVSLAVISSAVTAAGAHAAVVFDGSPGTAAPPSTLGGFTMTPFAANPAAESTSVTTVPGPTGNLIFSAPHNHVIVPSSWGTWSHGYAGDAYWTNGATSSTFALPANTGAFYLYAEPNPFGTFDISATTNAGGSSGPIPVDGSSGARYFGFSTTGGDTLATISVSSGVDFALGEFAIAAASAPSNPYKCNGKPATIYPGNGISTAKPNDPMTVTGTRGDDVIVTGNGTDIVDGAGGNDTICTNDGDDKARGGAGDDFIFGGRGDDDLGGQSGIDEVIGAAGNDRVNGGADNDKILGGDGNDIMNGGDGDDTVRGGLGDDVLAGNDGTDVCSGGGGSDRVTQNGSCESYTAATVGNNTAAPTSSGDSKVVAAAESEGTAWSDGSSANPSRESNPAELMPPSGGDSNDVEGGNVTAYGER